MDQPKRFHGPRRPGQSQQGASPKRRQSRWRSKWVLVVALIMLGAGLYLLLLVLSPTIKIVPAVDKTSIDLNTKDDASDSRNRVQIAKINLEVPFFEGGAEELEKGAWHRYPERGNPEKGGNFILSAHRFKIGLTPSQTKYNSPFYNIGVLNVGDPIRVFYNGKWYDYVITKKYSVKPTDVYIEGPSAEAKLTLYSCTLGGSTDGRDVIEAKLKDTPPPTSRTVTPLTKEQIRNFFGAPLNQQPKPKSTPPKVSPTPKPSITPTPAAPTPVTSGSN